MKIFFNIIITLFGLVSLSVSQVTSYTKAPKPVVHVNSESFSGLWYEIARTYNSFEKGCVAPTVEYKLIEQNRYEVFNRCFKDRINGELITYNGTAKSINGDSMSEIEKTYFWIFSKDYRVIYLDNYKTAIMVDEDMQNVWIMNRKPILEKEKLQELVSFLSKYMDTSKLIYSPQDKNGKYK